MSITLAPFFCSLHSAVLLHHCCQLALSKVAFLLSIRGGSANWLVAPDASGSREEICEEYSSWSAVDPLFGGCILRV